MFTRKLPPLALASLVMATNLISPNAAGAVAQGETVRDGNTVTYSGQILMRIRTGAGGYTAEQRAEAVKERLGPILSLENLKPEEVTVRQERAKQDASIYVRDRLLITVDRTLARANGNGDPGALARAWADRLRGILPGVSVKQSPTAN